MSDSKGIFQLVVLAALAMVITACGGSGGGDDDDSASVDASTAVDGSGGAIDGSGAGSDASTNSDLCYPTGIYGDCDKTGCPMCLSGATIYKTCAISCTTTADCGNAADFNGAMPLCAPLNPGSTDMICVLTCTSQDQCPCGLECRPSGAGPMICAITL